MKPISQATLLVSLALATALSAGCGRKENTVDTSTIASSPPTTGAETPPPAVPPPAVDASAGAAIDDSAITGKVKAALVGDVGLKTLSIDVDTAGGVVTLKGDVESQQQADQAKTVAQAVEGVKSVDSKLAVKVKS